MNCRGVSLPLKCTDLIPRVSLPLLAPWRSLSHLVNSALVSLLLPIVVVNVLWSCVIFLSFVRVGSFWVLASYFYFTGK